MSQHLPWALCLALAASAARGDQLTDAQACAAALRETPATPHDGHEGPLRIVSWNAMKFGIEGALDELQRITLDAHFLFLQEALQSYAHNPVPQYRERVFSAGYRRDDLQTGVEIRSSFDADLSCGLNFQEPWLRTEKAVAVARIPLPGQALLLVNLHAINFTLGSSAFSRQLEAIGDLIEAHRGPLIVGGDFNTWNPWRQWVFDGFRERFGLRESLFVPDWRSRHLAAVVDSFLYRDLLPISATAVPTERSDHHPIFFSFALLPAGSGPAVDSQGAAGVRGQER